MTDCNDEGVVVGGKPLPARTILWAAGVAASPAAQWLGMSADRAGRAEVEPDLTIPGHPEIFVIGDTAKVAWKDGKMVPGVAPAAKQQAWHVAKTIRARLGGESATRPFAYKHDGDMATIGKWAAVVDFGWMKLTGWPAWWLWGIAHIFFLIGLRYRIAVMLSWLWIYLTGQRSARLITQRGEAPETAAQTTPEERPQPRRRKAA